MSSYLRCDNRSDKAFIHVDVCDRCKKSQLKDKRRRCKVFPAWLAKQIEEFDEELYADIPI